MVFEADYGDVGNVALHDGVSDQAALASHSLHVDDSQAVHHHVVHGVMVTQELIPSAYGQKHAGIGNVGREVGLAAHHGIFHNELLAVGTAADENDIGRREVNGIAHPHFSHLRRNIAPLATTTKRHDVAAVAVKIQKLWEEVHDVQWFHD